MCRYALTERLCPVHHARPVTLRLDFVTVLDKRYSTASLRGTSPSLGFRKTQTHLTKVLHTDRVKLENFGLLHGHGWIALHAATEGVISFNGRCPTGYINLLLHRRVNLEGRRLEFQQ